MPLQGAAILQVIPHLGAGGAERTTIEVAEALKAAGAIPIVASVGGRLEGELAGPSPGALLGCVLDELVEDKVVSKKHREGAEIRVWSAVHGFASLAQSGPLTKLSPKARADALDELLLFTIAGLRG